MDNSWSSNENSESESKPEVNSKENNENDLKNISPYMSKDLIAAAGFNVETPIVNAIIGNLTGSLPTKKSETEMIKCEICDCLLSSNTVFNFHINGAKHQKRIKALEIIAQLKDAKDQGVQLGDSENPNAFRCEICSLTVNSALQLEIHLSGAKHKKKAAKAIVSEPVTTDSNKNSETSKNSEPSENTGFSSRNTKLALVSSGITFADNNASPPQAKKKKKDEPTLIPCDICNVSMNSQIQYDQHLLSRKHLNKASGKQQPRKLPGKGKFFKFPNFRSERPQFPMNPSNHAFQNEGNQYSPQMYNRLLPNFVPKHPFCNCRNGNNNSNSFRQSPANQFQRRF